MSFATNSKINNVRDMYRGINEFKMGYQPRNNLVKDENGDLLADSHNILNSWKNYLSQLMNVHNGSDVRLMQVHTAEPLVPGPSRLEVEIAIAKLNCRIHDLRSTNSLIMFGIRKTCLISGRSLLLSSSQEGWQN
jgi:hypothetical protein